jgi:hypothetical protein
MSRLYRQSGSAVGMNRTDESSARAVPHCHTIAYALVMLNVDALHQAAGLR